MKSATGSRATPLAGPTGSVRVEEVGAAEELGTDLADAIEEFLGYLQSYRQASPLTINAYRRDLSQLRQFPEGRRLPTRPAEITTRMLQAFAVSTADKAPATVIRALNAASSLFSYLCRCGQLDRNPVQGVVKPKRSFARAQVSLSTQSTSSSRTVETVSGRAQPPRPSGRPSRFGTCVTGILGPRAGQPQCKVPAASIAPQVRHAPR